MDKSAFGLTVNDREIPSLSRLVKVVALRCRHNVQKLFTIYTRTHTLNILPCSFHDRNASIFLEYMFCVHWKKETNASAIKLAFRTVHPNHVFAQWKKSSNAECFFLNPSTTKTITPTSRMRKRETKKCIFCVLVFWYDFPLLFFLVAKRKRERERDRNCTFTATG